ncbi:CoF synthetase [Flavivirga aquimarina]|uniref:CoF synthetase n=1 Tax=Flavivirga aquimarina TaxID=2027862 RepID=A0ABT8W7I1_9FLAO|nr:CoF synthetase [Flavivirga aquimarina]MDO5969060.1 CoF synthetase [Flavivirga aquimarina]
MKKQLEYARYITFWFLDFLKGSKIKNHVKNITFVLENFSNPKAKLIRKKSIDNILKHAVETTPFYKKYKNYTDIKDFPVINKSTINENINQFKSVSFINCKTKTASTSGSTGAVLKIEHNKNKILRNFADVIYFSGLVGFKIGYQILFFRHWDDDLRKTKLVNWKNNIVELEVLNLSDAYISNTINKIKNDSSTKIWQGYPSGFELICKYLDKNNASPIHANIKSIITVSEQINTYTKQSIKKYFNAPVFSRYSNTENGIIAQQLNETNDDFTINWASYYIEVLQFDKDLSAKSGEIGRIVVTDLFNYSMPMIRYDTGDIGSINYNVSPPTFKKIEGRKTDIILNTKGDIVTSFIIANVSSYKGIIQGQLIQETQKEYTLKLNITDEFKGEVKIIKEFKSYLGEDALITIEYVDEIPILSSGKRKSAINNYIKTLSN